VNISIEGSRETHDYLRGPGTFDKALSGLANLRKYKIESTVAATVSRYNYKDLLYVLEVAKDYGATTVRLQPFNTIFLKDQRRKKEFLIDRRDIPPVEEVIKKFIIVSREYKIAVNPAGYLLKIPEYLSGQNFYPDNCGALWYSCPINPNGDLFPCWIEGANNKLIGNVKKEGLYKLWLSDKRIKMVGSIIKNGCKGCLMSCYDEAFDRRMFKESIADSAKKIKKITNYRKMMNKILQSLRSQVTRMKLRYRFYVSYRGSFPSIFVRRLRRIFTKPVNPGQGKKIEKELALLEIDKAKKRLKGEVRAL
jgi:radical SAM protein with 4Fe4S-binding SPASM domain